MSRCPITGALLPAGQAGRYSREGLRRLSPQLADLAPLPFGAAELLVEAAARADQMSVQGVQPKLSARLDARAGRFVLVDAGGRYILKPPSPQYPHLPENEHLTMGLAAIAGIEVPAHGLVAGSDGAWTYFSRRFDREARGRRLAVEDFAQLSGRSRDTKYDSSLEQVAAVIDRHATFPLVEHRQFLRRVLFCFLTGGEDMHLKNWSLITRPPRVQLAPAYDLLNTTIVLRTPREESALPLNGRQRNLRRRDFTEHLGVARLRLPVAVVEDELERLRTASAGWREVIEGSFLPPPLREAYLRVVPVRARRLWR
ncbi:HipA domain-containing protein [bacterium]|nr:HipA domain-containing protein [bacterium]